MDTKYEYQSYEYQLIVVGSRFSAYPSAVLSGGTRPGMSLRMSSSE
jgi:hypothetical protein